MHFADSDTVLEFVGSARCEELARLGTTCPDHFLRTRVRPLYVPFEPPRESAADLIARLPALVEQYRERYTAYYERCRRPDSPSMRDPYPVIVLMPGLGLLAFQKDAATARVSAEFYESTIRIIRWAEGSGRDMPIPEQEAFDMCPGPSKKPSCGGCRSRKSLEKRFCLVSGGDGGIGRATAARPLSEGDAMMLADVEAAALNEVEQELGATFGDDRLPCRRLRRDSDTSVGSAFAAAVNEFGGLDILVSNAGIASASPVDETTVATWQRTIDVLATGTSSSRGRRSAS